MNLRILGKVLQVEVNQILSRMIALHDSNAGGHVLPSHAPVPASAFCSKVVLCTSQRNIQQDPYLYLGNFTLAVM